MSKTESILLEIDQLSPQEFRLLMEKLFTKMEKLDRLKASFQSLKGAGKGLWKEDAQSYVSKLREEE